MAVIRISKPPITRETYEAVNAKLNAQGMPPDGLIMHSAGEVDGKWQIVDVWESDEHARRFDADRLTPAVREAGTTIPEAPPSAMLYELHTLILP